MKFATNVAKYVLLFPLRHMEQQNNLKKVEKKKKKKKKKKKFKVKKNMLDL